jgi:inosine/xanthosine triphosphate pyrophosphatase family protein
MELEALQAQLATSNAKQEALEQEIIAQAEQIELLKKSQQETSANITTERKVEPLVPTVLKIGKKEYRLKAHKVSLDGKKYTVAEIKEDNGLCARLLDEFPGLFELV